MSDLPPEIAAVQRGQPLTADKTNEQISAINSLLASLPRQMGPSPNVDQLYFDCVFPAKITAKGDDGEYPKGTYAWTEQELAADGTWADRAAGLARAGTLASDAAQAFGGEQGVASGSYVLMAELVLPGGAKAYRFPTTTSVPGLPSNAGKKKYMALQLTHDVPGGADDPTRNDWDWVRLPDDVI